MRIHFTAQPTHESTSDHASHGGASAIGLGVRLSVNLERCMPVIIGAYTVVTVGLESSGWFYFCAVTVVWAQGTVYCSGETSLNCFVCV